MVSSNSYEYLSNKSLASSLIETTQAIRDHMTLTLRRDTAGSVELTFKDIKVADLADPLLALSLDLVEINICGLI